MGQSIAPDLLSETLAEVLEEAAFIFTEEADETLPWHSNVVESSILYEGQENGTLSLAVDTDMAQLFAANLLGIDTDEPDASSKSNDALSEILNIVCGVFLERWLGINNHCRLGIPTTVSLSAEQQKQSMHAAKCSAVLEDEDGNRIDIYVR